MLSRQGKKENDVWKVCGQSQNTVKLDKNKQWGDIEEVEHLVKETRIVIA